MAPYRCTTTWCLAVVPECFSSLECRVPVGTVDAVLSYCHNNLADDTLTKELPYLESKQVSMPFASLA